MIVLGIESTAHTFSIGIVKQNKKAPAGIEIIANCRDAYTTEKGGIIPAEAAKHHDAVKEKVLQDALAKAGVTLQDIDVIAYSQSPGLAPCLMRGTAFAKELAVKLGKKIIPVNHCVAHLEIGRITGAKDPVLLYASGANTQIIAYASGKFRVFGETLDIGVGNFIDTFARHCGIGFPGGPKIQELAKKGEYKELPYSIKGMDVSFSGLLTHINQKYDKGAKIEDLAFSLQETAFSMLIEAAERAMAHLGKKELLLGGGVACNTRLQEMAAIMCRERDAKFFCPPNEFLVDNGAMIAFTGMVMKTHGKNNEIFPEHADFDPAKRTDEILVNWK